jgi:hypothetical protein
MKTLVLSFAFLMTALAALAQNKKGPSGYSVELRDSVKLQVEGEHAYYQQAVKADSIPEAIIYVRAIQFMASKNFQQNYGYEEEGKLIFTTAQDLNVNPVYVGDDDDQLDPYTVQFSITLDLKNRLYRYTISNVVFFRPTADGNKRETLYEMYVKETNTDSRRVAKDAKKLIGSFERYLDNLVSELHEGIEQKSSIYSKFK